MSLTLEEMLKAAQNSARAWLSIEHNKVYSNSMRRGFSWSYAYVKVRNDNGEYSIEMTFKDMVIGKYKGPEVRELFEAVEEQHKSIEAPFIEQEKKRKEKRAIKATGVLRKWAGGSRDDKSPLRDDEIYSIAEKLVFERYADSENVKYKTGKYFHGVSMEVVKKVVDGKEDYSVELNASQLTWKIASSSEVDEKYQNKKVFGLVEEAYLRRVAEKQENTRRGYVTSARGGFKRTLPSINPRADFTIEEAETVAAKAKEWSKKESHSEKENSKTHIESIEGILPADKLFSNVGLHNMKFKAIKSQIDGACAYSAALEVLDKDIFKIEGEEAERIYNLAQEHYGAFQRDKEAELEAKRGEIESKFRESFTGSRLPLSRRIGR